MIKKFDRPISAPQVNVGNNVNVPDCCKNEPRLVIKSSCCPNEYSKIENSAIVFVDDKDDLLKTKDTKGNTTSLTYDSFGSYNYINPNSILTLTLLPQNATLTISELSTISKKDFTNPFNGYIKYKSHLKRAIKVDISILIVTGVGLTGNIFAIVTKSDTPTIPTGGESITFAKTFITGTQTLSGSVIFKNVEHGDYFSVSIINNSGAAASMMILSTSVCLSSLPKGTD